MLYTYDRNPSLRLALVATDQLAEAAYVPIDAAPADACSTTLPYLRQLHAIANSVACGLTVQTRHELRPADWQVLGA